MDLIATFSKNLTDYNSSTMGWVTNIITNATTQVAFYLAAIVLVMELVKIFERVNTSSNGVMMPRFFAEIAWRGAVSGVMIALSRYLVEFMVLVGIGLVKLMGKYANGAFDVLPNVDISSSTSIWDTIGGILTGNFLSFALAYSVGVLISLAAYVMLTVLIMLRFFQLYVLLALSPLPMASFASAEHQNIGITYLKYIGAYALQPAVLLTVVGVYHFMSTAGWDISGWQVPGMMASIDGIKELLSGIVQGIIFIIALWQSHNVSSKLLGV